MVMMFPVTPIRFDFKVLDNYFLVLVIMIVLLLFINAILILVVFIRISICLTGKTLC